MMHSQSIIQQNVSTPLNLKRQKTTKKQSGSSPRVEPARRTARAAERSFEVVLNFQALKSKIHEYKKHNNKP